MADSSPTDSRSETMISRIRSDFASTTTWVLIPIGVGLNAAGSFIANALKLPLFIDNVGTVLLAILVGPWAAALTGAIGSIVGTLLGRPTKIAFIMTPVTIGLVAGFLARRGFFQNWKRVIAAGIPIAFISVILSTPVVIYLFGGVTESGTSLITSIFVASGFPLAISALISQLMVDIVDKTITVYAAYLVAKSVPIRYLPAQGQKIFS